jgi:putative iron-dependent peroxidase
MATPQTGIFSIGDPAHIYLEFSLLPDADPAALVKAVVDIHEPHTTVGGVNVVMGFRPEMWGRVAPAEMPAALAGFNEPLAGCDGYAMPATQADLWLWIAGASYDVVFDVGREAIAPLASVDRELSGWSYRHSRDLTGFEDGTENPSLMVAPGIVTVPDGAPGAGGSVLLFQKWQHRAAAWEALPVAAQERVMGRTKPESTEFAEDVMPHDAHVARTQIEIDGTEHKIFRRNTAYGTVMDFGTVFVGFSTDQDRLNRMLRRMAGSDDGLRDALTNYSDALTGAYYFVPSLQALQTFATPEED